MVPFNLSESPTLLEANGFSGGFALEVVEGFLNVNGGDVVGEEDDLICMEFVLVFAEQVGGFDDAKLEQADDESAGAGKGIDEMNVLCGE